MDGPEKSLLRVKIEILTCDWFRFWDLEEEGTRR